MTTGALVIALFAAGIRLATPIAYAAFGGLFSERSGVTNIGLEGNMVIGAFGGYLIASITQNAWLGVLGGGLCGALIGLIYSLMAVIMKADQIVLGTGVNMLATALTSFFFRSMYKKGYSVFIPKIEIWEVPVLSRIPVIGDVFFKQNPLVYIAYILIPLLTVFLFRTRFGLNLRACGENPLAVKTTGINVYRVRILAITFTGFLCGIGGAFLPICQLASYSEGLIAGRGFIALATIVFGQWHPAKVYLGCVMFGLADALQLRLQGLGLTIPAEFLIMFPYFLTLVIYVGVVRRSKSPQALGKPF